MIAAVADMRDLVQVHVSADLPIRARGLPFADRVEIRFGKAFPVVLVVDRAALDRLNDAIQHARAELDTAVRESEEG